MLKPATLCSRRFRSLAAIPLLLAMGNAVVSAQVATDPTLTPGDSTSNASAKEQAVVDVSLDEARAMGANRSSYRRSDTEVREWKAPQPQLADFRNTVGPILNRSCLSCHGPDTQEGSFRVDTLDPDLLHGDDVDWWIEVMDVLSNGEMPPPDETQMEDEERSEVIDWLSTEIQIASSVRRIEAGHSSFRRMTGYEFNYALQDLLGLPYDFTRDLTPDSTSQDGFLNSSEMLHMSAIQFDSYQELSRQAFHRATVRGTRPNVLHWQVSMRDASAEMFAKQQSDLDDAKLLRRSLSANDRQSLDEYLQAVRATELKVEKARRWMSIPLPTVGIDHLNLDITPEDPRDYLRTMFELIYLAFKTDSTRVATWQLGRENGVGVSDYLARAVGFNLTHQLSHKTKEPDGWKNFGTYCSFLSEEFGRFATRLKQTPEPHGSGNMLDSTLLLFGSASSAFHLSRNYPLILAGGKGLGFKHGQYLNYAQDPAGGAWHGGKEPWMKEVTQEEIPLSNVFLTMLQRLGVKTDSFGGSTTTFEHV